MRRWMGSLVSLVMAFAAMSGSSAAQNTAPPSNLRPYFLVLLRHAGADEASVQSPDARQAYIDDRFREGAYKIRARVTDGGSLREALIVTAPDMASARTMIENDPLVRTARVFPEIHPMLAPDLSALDTASAPPGTDGRSTSETYYLVMLVNPGPERIPMSEQVFAAHMAYRNARSAAGEILTGGPVTDGGRIRGVSLVRAASLESAIDAARLDPAVQAGILTPETHPVLSGDLSRLSLSRE